MNSIFPNNKKFIFTIIDDTDDAFADNIKKVYDVLYENNIITTKTVWVYPLRDIERSKGESLQNINYKKFIIDIRNKGFEIALHNVGSGEYFRDEIISGLNDFNSTIGYFPNLHINHSYNPDNIYCGSKRFSFPFNYIVKYLYSKYDSFDGEVFGSKHFWGDYHKKYITYSRNYEIDDLNTLKLNPYMPYLDKNYSQYSNYWFSSTFTPNQWVFNRIVSEKSIDKLEYEGGVCILYTHLGYYVKDGKVNEGFSKMMKYIGRKKTGLYIPVSNVLDLLSQRNKTNNKSEYIPTIYKKYLEFHSLKTRIKYRYINKIDDYHFKKSGDYEFN